jgi:hypothetical protein
MERISYRALDFLCAKFAYVSLRPSRVSAVDSLYYLVGFKPPLIRKLTKCMLPDAEFYRNSMERSLIRFLYPKALEAKGERDYILVQDADRQNKLKKTAVSRGRKGLLFCESYY